MNVSVIIPSYGRPAVLQSCLASFETLAANDISSLGEYEIVVVNNNPDRTLLDETSLVCSSFPHLPVKELRRDCGLGSCGARNAGIEAALGSYLVFLDDDTEVQPGYFFRILRYYRDRRVGGVGGAEDKGPIPLPQRLWALVAPPGQVTWAGNITGLFFSSYPRPRTVHHLHGSNFSLRSEVVRAIGLLDPAMEGHWRDETEFTFRATRAGWRLVFEPRAVVRHNTGGSGGNIAPGQLKRWAYWYNRNTGYFFYKHLHGGNPFRECAFLFQLAIQNAARAVVLQNAEFLWQTGSVLEARKLVLAAGRPTGRRYDGQGEAR